MPNFLDSGLKFTRLVSPTWEESVSIKWFPILDILSRSGNIHDQSRKLCKISPNFACFWPPKFFTGGLPEFLDLHYKIDADTDHVASSGRPN